MWCNLPDDLRSRLGGFDTWNGVCFLSIDFGEGFDLHVSASGLPFVVLFEEYRADGAGDRGLVRDYADDIGAAFDLFVQVRDGVGAVLLFLVLTGKGHIDRHVMFAGVHECGQFGSSGAQ